MTQSNGEMSQMPNDNLFFVVVVMTDTGRNIGFRLVPIQRQDAPYWLITNASFQPMLCFPPPVQCLIVVLMCFFNYFFK